MADVDLGKIGITPKGEWVSGTTYERLDAVSHLGSSYLALTDTAVEPAKEGADWMLLSEGISTEGVEQVVDSKFESLSKVATSGAYSDLAGTPQSLPANGGNADTVDGFHASQDSVANNIVVRDANGYIDSGIKTNEAFTDAYYLVFTNTNDNVLRKTLVKDFKKSIGIGSIEANSVFSGACWAPSALSSTSYLKIGTIEVGGWVGPMFHLTVGSRGGTYRKALICFKDGTNGDLDFFKITPTYHSHSASYAGRDGKIYLVKTATYTWDVYIPLSTSGNMGYFGFCVNVASSFTRNLVVVSSLPTGYVPPTEVTNLTEIP